MSETSTTTIIERLRWTIAIALVALAAAFAAHSAIGSVSSSGPSVARSSWGTDAVTEVARARWQSRTDVARARWQTGARTVDVARSSWGAADVAADLA
jgi:hypothetical protein